MIETVNGRYALKYQIGEGGMGVVYRAYDRLTDQTVALKRVRLHPNESDATPYLTNPDEMRSVLAKEFQIMAGLRHPHIISVLDYGFDQKSRPFYTMTYLPASQSILDAASYLHDGAKIDLVGQLVQGLAYLHHRGILHRDIKPKNVLVTGRSVRLLDFGLSHQAGDKGTSGGSPLYIAPEILEGSEPTGASDLYAVGVLLYQLMTGQHPFGHFDLRFYDRLFLQEPDWGLLNPKLHLICQTLLAKDPAKRALSANGLLLALAETGEYDPLQETAPILESYLQAARFVGRQEEMSILTAGLDRAGNGRGSAWLIGGESGVGKSRLLRELQTVGLVNGLQLLTGQAEDDAANGAYQIWREPLRQMIVTLSDLDDLAASTLLPLVPDIARLLNRSVEPATNLTRGATQIRLFSIVTNLFRQIERPILLILEDLHWETESLSLLTHLISQIETLPLMVVGSFRNDERPNLVDLLSGMQLINLERLSERNMAQLSASMLGEIGQKPEIVAYLQHETEGNAFFAVEIVRALTEEAGRLDLINQTLLPEKLLPSGILQVVERLFNKIPEEARPLLRLAAVAGRQIDIDLLMLADQSGQDVEGVWLQTCADRGIFEIQDGRWRFRHDKLREWLLDTLSESDCQQFHQHIAFSLETLYGEGPIYAGRLAYHWSEAGEFEKEEAYAILAGDYAKEQYLIDEAQLFYQRALELIGNPTTPGAQIKKIDLLNKLADVLTNSAPAKAYQLAEEARTLTTTGHLAQQPYGAGLAQSINRMGSASGFQGQHSKAFVHYEEAAPLLKASGDLTNYAHTLFSISSAYYNRGFIDEAEAYILQAKAIGEELEDKAILARAYMGLSIMNSTANRLDGVTAYMDTALVLMREIGDRRSEAMMLLNAAVTLNKLSRLEEAVEKALAGLAIAEEINDFQIAIRVSCNIVNYYTNLKAYDTAWEYVRRSLDRLEGKEIWELEVLVYSSLFELSNRQQKFEEARQYAEPALRAVQKIDQPRYTSQLLKGLIDIYAALGENDKAAKLEEMLSEPI